MLAITKMPNFGFGNKLLYYFNLRQASHQLNCHFHCCQFEGLYLFQGPMQGSDLSREFSELELCLGEKFFTENPLNTREIFKIKAKKESQTKNCAIHFRGTDFHRWNPQSILSTNYYLASIEEVKNDVDVFTLFTDDQDLESFKKTCDFLKFKGKEVRFGENTNNRNQFEKDFLEMCNSEVIISSPSTFCICAGMIGTKKQIIHSSAWVNSRVEKNDTFWVKLSEGGNQNYKLWKTF